VVEVRGAVVNTNHWFTGCLQIEDFSRKLKKE